MKPLAVLGTSSDAGKTTIVMALCRILADRGMKVAPFKAQNVSNNSGVTQEGREISRAQCLQAEAARIEPSYLFNPVLLKSHGKGIVQVIVNGLVYKNQSIVNYYAEMDYLKEQVRKAFSTLQERYDLIIAEGAGSPVELNLLHKDLSNTFIAKTFNTKNILVADIERGGVFASIYGTLALMDPVMRSNLIGVIVNKFRGDRNLFIESEKIITGRFGVPVLGVLPFKQLNIDMEDSQSLSNYKQRLNDVKIRVAVIAYPGFSNYNDLDVLMADEELYIELIHVYQSLGNFDILILPGSKTVIRDLKWLKEQGLFKEIQQFKKTIFGICGGYQMLSQSLHDADGLEYETACVEIGLGFIDDIVVYQSPKILARGQYQLFSYESLTGYEIHCGRMAKYPLYYPETHGINYSLNLNQDVAGTHVHAIFDNNEFRNDYFKKIHADYKGYDYGDYRKKEIQEFTDGVEKNLDINPILKALRAD
ncbi:cobyric acid synthase [Methylobacter sp. S3L5C]|uniref:cobyric acid synthase n=1 Tax=Methylobacter sp. S3L5C TaxID=2839024 RepID=UPI001FACB3F8|nr:cobyric acid synthase [Methylobacter sp. S3L5C]UOA07096.1 cobyric acid synthase [Methylobacter sp. S3L5C]